MGTSLPILNVRRDRRTERNTTFGAGAGISCFENKDEAFLGERQGIAKKGVRAVEG